MNGYIEKLGSLGFAMDHELSIDLVLQSLPDSYAQFVLNFQMNKIDCTLPELINMHKTVEPSIKKEQKSIMVVNSSGPSKKNKKAKKQGKKNTIKPKGGIQKKTAKNKDSSTKGPCFHCNKMGHWKRNCKEYLESIKKKKQDVAFTSGIYVIEINAASNNNAWVLDTGCGSHICSNVQGLKSSRRLKKGEVDLRVANGAKVAALFVGTYSLSLPSGLVLDLEDCFYVPSISRNIISISSLCNKGFEINFMNNCCSAKLNDIFYFSGTINNGIYLLDQSSQILNLHTKRLKTDNIKPSFLWHCRLCHISEKRLSKLHKFGDLGSFEYDSYDTCDSCLLGKMTKTPFSGKGERANELLELIHSDVCGPMTIQARGGFQYFITFIDDYSRYGYVYLMKYKSEAFEKFKELKHEVEKQLGKVIKVLRSDRGGEYLNQEFQSYLKENGIISQWTPPHTPQHNRVSERRTLLDMVRSMMGLANSPRFLWGYALETAAYILNRVPSKSVETTPYEIWSKKKPSFSYMKI